MLQYRENTKLNLFDILWPEVRSESKKSDLFLYRKERMINLGKQSGLIWSAKIRECLIWTFANVYLAVVLRYAPSKHMHSVGVHVPGWVLPSASLLSPTTTSDHERIPLAWCCSAWPSEAHCLCHFPSFLCLYNLCWQPRGPASLCGLTYSTGCGMRDHFCWVGP